MTAGECFDTALVEFLETLRFTHQTRREIAEWLPEIAYREGVPVSKIINNLTIQTILRDEKMNAPQKSKKIHDALYRMRFPEFSRLRDKWKRAAAAAVAGSNFNSNKSKVRFIPSPAFEKNRLEIRLSVDSIGEALDILGSLSKVDQGVWDDLMYPR